MRNTAITVLMNLSVTGKDFSMTVLYRGLSQSELVKSFGK